MNHHPSSDPRHTPSADSLPRQIRESAPLERQAEMRQRRTQILSRLLGAASLIASPQQQETMASCRQHPSGWPGHRHYPRPQQGGPLACQRCAPVRCPCQALRCPCQAQLRACHSRLCRHHRHRRRLRRHRCGRRRYRRRKRPRRRYRRRKRPLGGYR